MSTWSFSQLDSVFGNKRGIQSTGSVSFSDFYRGSTNVTQHSYLFNIPTGGPIALSNFTSGVFTRGESYFTTGNLFTTTGNSQYTFTVPNGVSSLSIVCVGGGGGGGISTNTTNSARGSGGGGALYYTNGVAVSAGQTLLVNVGAGGIGGESGANSGLGGWGGNSWVSLANTVYPPLGLTSNTASNITAANYGNGTYIASASSVRTEDLYEAYRAFDKIIPNYLQNTSGNFNFWHCASNVYFGSSGNYAGSISTTAGSNVYLGEWLQIQLPENITMRNYAIIPRTSQTAPFSNTRSPRDFVVLGSTDGSSWTLLDQETDVTSWDFGSIKQFNVASQGSYNYYRLVTSRVGSTSGTDNLSVQIAEWELNPNYLCLAQGGFGGTTIGNFSTPVLTASGGNYGNGLGGFTGGCIGTFGGAGGRGAYSNIIGRGGGGAGGYIGSGGFGGIGGVDLDNLQAFGGGGAGGGRIDVGDTTQRNQNGHGGGGVGLFGIGVSGSVGSLIGSFGGVAGSSGTSGSLGALTGIIGGGGSFGGGGGSSDDITTSTGGGGSGGSGGVRIAWSSGQRTFPNTNVGLLVDYPPVALSGTSTSLSATSNSLVSQPYGNGTYFINVSSRTQGSVFQPFDRTAGNRVGFGTEAWYAASSGNYIGSATNGTLVGSTTFTGEYIQIQLPSPITLDNYSIIPQYNTTQTSLKLSPRDFVMLGSNNGSTWALLDQKINYTNWPTIGSLQTFTTSSFITTSSSGTFIVPYSYYRLQASRLGTLDNDPQNQQDRLFINQLYLNGSETTSLVYPPVGLTTSQGSITASYGSGTYIASASTTFSPNFARNAFDNDWSTYWNSNAQYNGTTGAYTGTASTTVGSIGYSGEWLQLQLPTSIFLHSHTLFWRESFPSRVAGDYILAGSTGGTVWSLIETRGNLTVSDYNSGGTLQGSFTTAVPASSPFSYYRLITSKLGPIGTGTQRTSVNMNWILRGSTTR